MTSTRGERLPPEQRWRFGAWIEVVGTALLAVCGAAVVVLAPVYGLRAVLGQLGTGAVLGTIVFPFGEALQLDARRDVAADGGDVPEVWQRERGTFELLDRHAGDLLRTRVVDLPLRSLLLVLVVLAVALLAFETAGSSAQAIGSGPDVASGVFGS